MLNNASWSQNYPNISKHNLREAGLKLSYQILEVLSKLSPLGALKKNSKTRRSVSQMSLRTPSETYLGRPGLAHTNLELGIGAWNYALQFRSFPRKIRGFLGYFGASRSRKSVITSEKRHQDDWSHLIHHSDYWEWGHDKPIIHLVRE